ILRELWAVTERIYPDDVAPCLLGGSALVPFTRSGQQRGDTTWTTAMATVTPDGCKLSADGDTLALEGDPSIVFELEGWRVDFKKGNNEFNMAITGAVTWSRTDGTSNSCGVDLTMEDGHMREEYGEIDGGLAGRLCGRDVSFHFSEIDWAVVE
ncbi:MAG: hypothetical protein J4F34_09000, partial [Gemmatimonadetes bacterium]|nr:hypothetical protein [Gemmatimonadota bacterium]